MAGFSLNDTIGLVMRIIPHTREIIDIWHRISALLQKMGLISGSIAPAHATHSFDVEWVQESLNTLTGSNLDIDGRIGPATTAAVTKYQESKGLDPDGWIGMLTLSAIEQDMLAHGSRGR
jgi:hypothetical protein